jgi:lipid A 3-O-deacylase
MLMFSGGAFDANKNVNPATEFGLQVRGGGRWWRFGPMLGVMATTDRGFDAYGGFSLDFPIGRGFALRPSFAPSLYSKGDGKDLHGRIQFRSGIEAAWRFGGGARLGVELYHLSNAGLQDLNPGEESLVLTLALPANRLFGHR